MKMISDNREARYRYMVLESVTAGIVLVGTEVKSAKIGQVQLRDAFVRIANEEAFLHNCHISHYSHGNIQNHEVSRTRKLLLKKSEIRKLFAKVHERGLTLIPLKMLLHRGMIKIEVGLCKGKDLRDKRQTIKTREADIEMNRALRGKDE
ncbi:MAG: SsrA-binding protein SmpB [Candidatus Lindowbacteria bacterium]|nr:SsrA-binding protein SmpB [Candidatus Lindowbacteria bacterium]